jgi:transcriptional regulator with XRE-family HTH domain
MEPDDSEINFILRTTEARIAAGFTQNEIAEILGLQQGTYKNYETNRPLPHRYIRRFCIACRIMPAQLFAMRERKVA